MQMPSHQFMFSTVFKAPAGSFYRSLCPLDGLSVGLSVEKSSEANISACIVQILTKLDT